MDKPIELMRIIRRPPLGKIGLEISGRQITRFDTVENAQTRQMVLAAIGDLVMFVGGYETLEKAGFVPPLIQPMANEPERLDEIQAAFLASLERNASSSASPSTSSREAAPVLLSSLQIAKKMDELLQDQLAAMPELRQQIVRIDTSPNDEIRIAVNGRFYESREEIADPLIRLALKLAAKKWEERVA